MTFLNDIIFGFKLIGTLILMIIFLLFSLTIPILILFFMGIDIIKSFLGSKFKFNNCRNL